MKTTGENTGAIEPERIRLLADRLCFLREGEPGLRRRHGLWRADKKYRDEYDREAERLAPSLLTPKTTPVEIETIGWKQLTLV